MSNAKRIAEIEAEIEWMNENLSGCDWCCGGGDEQMYELEAELKKLQSEKNFVVTVWTKDRGIATIPFSTPDATSALFTVMALEDVNKDSILSVKEEV